MHLDRTDAGDQRRARTVQVSLRGAAVGYADRTVLRDVDLDIGSGEAVAILGPNGAGKSTLIRGVLGLADVVAGSVELFGTPRARFRDWHRLGYVPQSHTVATGIPATVREVVNSGRLARKRLLQPFGAADRAAVREAIDLVGLGDRTKHPVGTLSGGQQRRVLIARALAAEPEVLLMDEPTAGVDARSRAALAETLGELLIRGTTVLVVTHELGEMAPHITRTIVVDGGRISYDGAPTAGSGGRSTADEDHGEHGLSDCEHLDPHDATPLLESPFRLATERGR